MALKDKLQAGQTQRGCWLGLGAVAAAEIAATAGFDWCLIDGEHAPYDIASVAAQARVLGPDACVRIPKDRDWMIKQVLDLGLHTVVVPMIDTAAQAREMANAMRYPCRTSTPFVPSRAWTGCSSGLRIWRRRWGMPMIWTTRTCRRPSTHVGLIWCFVGLAVATVHLL